MPTPTYDLIASTTLAAATSSVTFGSLPQTYRDLILIVNGQFTTATGLGIRFNGDTGANYPLLVMDNNGGTPRSATDASATSFYGSWSATTSGTRYNNELQLMDYSATDKHKTALWRNGYTDNGGTSRVSAFAGRWANTAAITSINIFATNMDTGFTFNLYGVIS